MTDLLTPVGQFSHPHLHEPHAFNDSSPARYSVEIVYDPEDPDWKEFKAKVKAEIKKQLNGKKPNPRFVLPFRSCDERVDDNGQQKAGFPEGYEFIRVWRKADQPWEPDSQVVDGKKRPAKPAQIYGGCEGRAFVRPFVYRDHGNGPGCSLALEAAQVTGKGNPIGAAPVEAADVFDEVESDDTDDDFAADDDTGYDFAADDFGDDVPF